MYDKLRYLCKPVKESLFFIHHAVHSKKRRLRIDFTNNAIYLILILTQCFTSGKF
jgi:hypothetical protein